MHSTGKYTLEILEQPGIRDNYEFNRAFLGKEEGQVKEVFGDESYNGRLEKLVISLALGKNFKHTRDTALGELTSLIGMNVLLLVYEAYTSRKLLGMRMPKKIAHAAFSIGNESGQNTTEKQLQFAFFEVDRLADKHGLQVKVRYYGDKIYVEKYMPISQEPR